MGDLFAATAAVAPAIDLSGWIPVALALIAAVQVIGMELLRRKATKTETKVVTGITEVKEAVSVGVAATDKLEKQINSNLEKQFKTLIAETLATERLRVQDKDDVKDQLIAVTAKASKAEGKLEGRTEQAQEDRDDAAIPLKEKKT